MARKTILVDDLDGSETGVTTHRLTVDGQSYEIDLCEENAHELLTVLKPYLAVARRAGGRAPRDRRKLAAAPAPQTSGSVSQFNREQRNEIREWARANGFEVADRGAFSKEVLEAYERDRDLRHHEGH